MFFSCAGDENETSNFDAEISFAEENTKVSAADTNKTSSITYIFELIDFDEEENYNVLYRVGKLLNFSSGELLAPVSFKQI